MKKIETEIEQKRKKRFTVFNGFIVVTTIFLAILQIIFANRLTVFSTDLAQYSKDQASLSMENDFLTKQVATATSLNTIASRAAELTFAVPDKFLVVKDEPVAFAR